MSYNYEAINEPEDDIEEPVVKKLADLMQEWTLEEKKLPLPQITKYGMSSFMFHDYQNYSLSLSGDYRDYTELGKVIIQGSFNTKGIVLTEKFIVRPLHDYTQLASEESEEPELPEYECIDGNHRLHVIREFFPAFATSSLPAIIVKV